MKLLMQGAESPSQARSCEHCYQRRAESSFYKKGFPQQPSAILDEVCTTSAAKYDNEYVFYVSGHSHRRSRSTS